MREELSWVPFMACSVIAVIATYIGYGWRYDQGTSADRRRKGTLPLTAGLALAFSAGVSMPGPLGRRLMFGALMLGVDLLALSSFRRAALHQRLMMSAVSGRPYHSAAGFVADRRRHLRTEAIVNTACVLGLAVIVGSSIDWLLGVAVGVVGGLAVLAFLGGTRRFTETKPDH